MADERRNIPTLLSCASRGSWTLWLRFADGVEGRVDMSTTIAVGMGAYRLLRDESEFSQARMRDGAVTWPCGARLPADIAYDHLRAAGAKPHPRPSAADPAFASFMYELTVQAKDGRFVGRRARGNRRRG